MKNLLSTLALAMAAICLSLGICIHLSDGTPVLYHGEMLPEDISQRQYAIVSTRDQNDSLLLTFPVRDSIQSISLIIKNLVPYDVYEATGYQVYQNEKLIFDYEKAQSFSRTQIIELNPIEPDSVLRLSILADWPEHYMQRPDPWRFLLGFAPSQPQIMLGSSRNIRLFQQLSSVVNTLILGALASLIVSNISLFIKARSEKYLFFISITSFVAFLSTILVSYSSVFRIPYKVYTIWFILLSSVMSVLSAIFCLYLYRDIWPTKNYRRVIAGILLLLAAAVGMCLYRNLRIYVFLRRILWLPVIATFFAAIQKKKQGARFLFTVYVAIEIVLFWMYASNELPPATSDVWRMHFRLSDACHLFFVLCCTVVINNRFAMRFKETERLSDSLTVLTQSLEEQVAQRTKQLVEEQTQKHNMMLNIFHDLRSPLFVLKNRLEMLSSEKEEDRQSLGMMKTRLEYVEHLVEDLFLVFKLENREILFEFDDTDLNALLTELAEQYQGVAQGKRVTLSYEGCGGPAMIWADAEHVWRAFQNLIDNALLYTKENGTIRIFLEACADGWLARVSDTGMGIAQESLSKIFERYYRSDARNTQSSGLGLSIVKEIIHAHHAEISVTSKEGEGTTFTIHFLNTVQM